MLEALLDDVTTMVRDRRHWQAQRVGRVTRP